MSAIDDQGKAARASATGTRQAEGCLEQMIARAGDVICDPFLPLDGLPAELARMAPQAPALELVLALASAADATQAVFGCFGESGQRAQRVWKQAAMIAVEVHFLSVTGAAHDTAQDMLAHWARERAGKGGA